MSRLLFGRLRPHFPASRFDREEMVPESCILCECNVGELFAASRGANMHGLRNGDPWQSLLAATLSQNLHGPSTHTTFRLKGVSWHILITSDGN